jgi:tRNA G37 N-methylase Trm5
MFSRGNISEKIRFGKVVCEDEIVLDMYAGIGYYTLPALVHGNAKHAYACEWNEHAAGALRYNLSQNGVSDRATVFVGDCRESFRENEALKIGFDRISLGLLPSSEGGWKTAVQALHIAKGGWLHVHGNVPTLERDNWGLWLCQRLLHLRDEWGGDRVKSHVVLCQHIERVKSFAPKIEHFVADIFLGPKERLSDHLAHINMKGHRSGIIQQTGEFRPVIGIVDNPSCALGEGILHQKWMMSDED